MWPRLRKWARRSAVSKVLPTPVSVPVIKRIRLLLGKDRERIPIRSLFPVEAEDLDVAWAVAAEDSDEIAAGTADLGVDGDFKSSAAGSAILAQGALDGQRQFRDPAKIAQCPIRSKQAAAVVLAAAASNNRRGNVGIDTRDTLQDFGGGGVNIDLAGRDGSKEVD